MPKIPKPKKEYSPEEKEDLMAQLQYNMTNSVIHGMLMKEHALQLQELYVELDLPGKNKAYGVFGNFVSLYDEVLRVGEVALLRSSKDDFDETTDKCCEISGLIHLLMGLHSNKIEAIKLELADRVERMMLDKSGLTP